ncbi:DUF3653 domain-containing protein [Paenibacillus thiaminolyticus]|uniref:DUF3653 domain-containing protein n=1 Tax=Paenibacillus thiaminolyticus TaxID=49283 RepID=UPI002542C730|nr:DUF3653 domain-containing protein [Paenibacillus thiaminolyticus]WII39210.1 DUF3653 domain-containing protein [Paenibacillus thiaminolyticus]
MSDIWTGQGIWQGWRITTDHDSNHGDPVLVSPDGRAFGPGDIAGTFSQADLAKSLGVSRAAINGRIQRGTLPEYDGQDKNGRGFWYWETIRHLFKD